MQTTTGTDTKTKVMVGLAAVGVAFSAYAAGAFSYKGMKQVRYSKNYGHQRSVKKAPARRTPVKKQVKQYGYGYDSIPIGEHHSYGYGSGDSGIPIGESSSYGYDSGSATYTPSGSSSGTPSGSSTYTPRTR